MVALASGKTSSINVYNTTRFLRILVYLVLHDAGKVSLEQLLLSWHGKLSSINVYNNTRFYTVDFASFRSYFS